MQNEQKLSASNFDIFIAKNLFCSSVHSTYRNQQCNKTTFQKTFYLMFCQIDTFHGRNRSALLREF